MVEFEVKDNEDLFWRYFKFKDVSLKA